MKVKKPTPKRIIWPPRMTSKRKRALALLREWSDKGIDIEYSAGAGMTITGTISELKILDDRRTSFLFRNGFGIHALLSTDLYEQVEITELGDSPVRVGFFRKNASGDGFSIKPKDERAKPQKDLRAVYEIFRQWERLDTMLLVHTGDGMRITVARGKVKELSDRFIFTIADTETVHLVVPDRSTFVRIEADGDGRTVMLFNEKSGLHFSVTNRVERPEDVMNRFAALTTLIQ